MVLHHVPQAAVPRGPRLMLASQLHGGPGHYCLAGHRCLCSGGHDGHPRPVSAQFPIHVSGSWGRSGADSQRRHGTITQIPPQIPPCSPFPTSYESHPGNTAVSSSGRHIPQEGIL